MVRQGKGQSYRLESLYHYGIHYGTRGCAVATPLNSG